MSKGTKLTAVCFVIMPNNEVKEWDELTPEEENTIRKKWDKDLSEVFSDYYSHHPSEFQSLIENT